MKSKKPRQAAALLATSSLDVLELRRQMHVPSSAKKLSTAPYPRKLDGFLEGWRVYDMVDMRSPNTNQR